MNRALKQTLKKALSSTQPFFFSIDISEDFSCEALFKVASKYRDNFHIFLHKGGAPAIDYGINDNLKKAQDFKQLFNQTTFELFSNKNEHLQEYLILKELYQILTEDLDFCCDNTTFLTQGEMATHYGKHSDGVDIFIIHLFGKKLWSFYTSDGEIMSKKLLSPGDCIFIPANTPHLVLNLSGTGSCHIAFARRR